METIINNQENQPQTPIDIALATVVPDVMPKKKNYLPICFRKYPAL